MIEIIFMRDFIRLCYYRIVIIIIFLFCCWSRQKLHHFVTHNDMHFGFSHVTVIKWLLYQVNKAAVKLLQVEPVCCMSSELGLLQNYANRELATVIVTIIMKVVNVVMFSHRLVKKFCGSFEIKLIKKISYCALKPIRLLKLGKHMYENICIYIYVNSFNGSSQLIRCSCLKYLFFD